MLYYPNTIVESLVIISGPVANHPKAVHVNAAYYADKIRTRTLLVYGKDDGYRAHADVWRMNNTSAELMEYRGGHDFAPVLDSVIARIVNWEKSKKRIKYRRRRRRMAQRLRL